MSHYIPVSQLRPAVSCEVEKVDLNSNQVSESSGEKSSAFKSSQKDERRKTEPANAYLQFLKAKKSALKAANPKDPKICLNMTEVAAEWKGLEDDQREVYKEMTKKEKLALGEEYRKNRSRKKKEIIITTTEPKKKQHKKKNPRTKKKEKVSFVDEISVLIKSLKDVDLEFSQREDEINEMKNVIQTKAVELAVGKTKLKIKTENKVGLKEKLANLKKIHLTCTVNNK